MRRAHGISIAGRDAMLGEQLFACALCRTTDFGKKGPQVDHDHGTLVLRGILCLKCNVGLGALCDDPALMRRAADYVEHFRQLADQRGGVSE